MQRIDSTRDTDCYNFARNDPFDWSRPLELVLQNEMPSFEYMRSIRSFRVPEGSLAIWYLGQNGFLLKDSTSPLIGIDLYLTNSCAATASDLPFRVDRQLPVFIEPEDLDVDVFVTTHSHQDHADPETIQRMPKPSATLFVGPFGSCRIYEECGVPKHSTRLVHPGENYRFGSASLTATFALPTDNTDLNHIGTLLEFGSGIRFFNTGDTAWAECLAALLPEAVDVCAVCINGGYRNLAPEQAAAITNAIAPRVAVPCHYDMMINNIGSPAMFKVALERTGSTAEFRMLRYYEPWLYSRTSSRTFEAPLQEIE